MATFNQEAEEPFSATYRNDSIEGGILALPAADGLKYARALTNNDRNSLAFI